MTMRSTLFVAASILASTSLWPATSRAETKCPLVIQFADLQAIGTVHKAAEYVVVLRLSSKDRLDRTYAVNFSAGSDPKTPPTATFSIAALTFAGSANIAGQSGIVAILGAADIHWINVDSVQSGSGPTQTCSAGSPFQLDTDPLKTASKFDDRSVDAALAPNVERLEGLQLTKNVLPDYPQIAMDKMEQGDVEVLFTVHGDGSTSDFIVYKSSGSNALDQAAIRAASDSSVSPARLPSSLGGSPIDAKFLIEYDFRLDYRP